MKNIWNKIENNKLYFTLFMLISFILFIFLLTGFYGFVIPGWNGLVNYIYSIENTTASGQSILSEIVIALVLLPVIIIFGNSYIFTEKKIPLKERLKFTWPFITTISVTLIVRLFVSTNSFKYFNTGEFVAALILYFFVGVFEEFLCRGWLLNEFIERFGKNKNGIIYSIFISSLIFGFMHITNIITAGQSVTFTLVQIIMAVFMGLGLGSIYLKTKNIWTVVILHALYDFSITMSQLNITRNCFSPSEEYNIAFGIMAVILNLIIVAPAWLSFFKIKTTTEINNIIGIETPIEQQEKDKKTISGVNTTQIVFVIIVSLFNLVGLAEISKVETCLAYKEKEVENYEITYSQLTNYYLNFNTESAAYCFEDRSDCNEITSEKISYNITFDNEKLIISDDENNRAYYKLDGIKNISIIEKDNKYITSLLKHNDDGYTVYYSDYLSLENHDINNYVESFKKLDLPKIKNIGYLKLSNNEIYPIFKTIYEDIYIVDNDNEIKLLKVK